MGAPPGEAGTFLQRVLAYTVDQLCRDDLGLLLRSKQPVFQAIRALCDALPEVDWSRVPPSASKSVADALHNLHDVYQRIRSLQVGQREIDAQIRASSAEVDDAWMRLWNAAGPVIATDYSQKDPAAALRAQIESALAEERAASDAARERQAREHQLAIESYGNSFATYNEEFDKQRRGIQDSQLRVSELLQAQVIKHHAKLFGDQADGHLAASRLWLLLAAGMAALTGLFVFDSYDRFHHAVTLALEIGTKDYLAPVYLGVSKLVAISLLASGTIWFSRLYRANRHNYVVNIHRHNALGTYDSLAAATLGDMETKRQILLGAARAMFDHQPTGYDDDSAAAPQPPVMNIVGKG